MFNKKNCSNCGKKCKDKYEFCPYCGYSINKNQKKDFGMLGENDEIEEFNEIDSIMNGFGGGILNKMLKNTMKMLEKEMQKEMKTQRIQPKSNMQLFINGKKIDIPNSPTQKLKKEKKQNIKSIHFSESNQEKFASLPQEEPKTQVKRLSDKILYELNVPKVKSLKDISIVRLENSIEIKAITKNKAYFKSIPISLILISYELNDDKLILEFESKE